MTPDAWGTLTSFRSNSSIDLRLRPIVCGHPTAGRSTIPRVKRLQTRVAGESPVTGSSPIEPGRGLCAEQVDELRRTGVLVARGLLAEADLRPSIQALSDLVNKRAAELLAAGSIGDPCAHEPFETRYAKLLRQSRKTEAGMLPTLMESPALFELTRNERLLDAVESILGTEIKLHPTFNIRPKPPASLDRPPPCFNVPPWHQDASSLSPRAEKTDLVICWIPLVDASVENGCLEVMPGVREYLPHQLEGGITIVPDRLPKVAPVALPCRVGDVIFLSGLTPHRSTPNLTSGCRWSLDIRYYPAGQLSGRPGYPSFYLRSKRRPSRVVKGFASWIRRWDKTYEKGVVRYFRDDTKVTTKLSRLT